MPGAAFQRIDLKLTIGAVALSVIYSAWVIATASAASFYTLDDPYIHMALAENIARGHLGVNLGEVSNPSSSILWPWLLAGFEKIGVMVWAPLLVNIACFVLSLRVLMAFALSRLGGEGRDTAGVLSFAGLMYLSFNLFGVIFTGMEHSLHVLVSLIAVTRVIDGKFDRLAFAALAVSPLIRFEGAAILAFGAGAAVVDRKFGFAAAVIGVAAAAVAAYAAWLTSLGLPVLPSSVLTKSGVSSGLVDGGGGIAASLLGTAAENVRAPTAPMFALFALALGYAAWKRTGRDRILAAGLLVVEALAFLLGKMNSYSRYEVYILCVLGVGAIHLLQPELGLVLRTRVRALAVGAAFVVVNGLVGLSVAVSTPMGARNVDRQQHQMHRFVTECWRKPVAVNDLGWVSFRNDGYVLDLYGLGNEAARKARMAGDPGWMAKLVSDAGVDVAMIYPQWFPDLPRTWAKVGELQLTDPQVTPFGARVSFYATRPEAVEPVRACLAWLHKNLPAGARAILD